MASGAWFWILFVIMVLFAGALYYPFEETSRRHAGVSLIILILIFLLGIGVFGWPIH